jgi:hypothetical protein
LDPYKLKKNYKFACISSKWKKYYKSRVKNFSTVYDFFFACHAIILMKAALITINAMIARI